MVEEKIDGVNKALRIHYTETTEKETKIIQLLEELKRDVREVLSVVKKINTRGMLNNGF